MKFITVRDFRTSSGKIWKQLPEEQAFVVTNNGKPVALLTPVNDTNLEESLSTLRRAKAMAAVEQMQRISIEKGNANMSAEEIEKEIVQTRKDGLI